jgi:hypothetical protein
MFFRVTDEICHNAAVDAETQHDVLPSTAIPESFLNHRRDRDRNGKEAVRFGVAKHV